MSLWYHAIPKPLKFATGLPLASSGERCTVNMSNCKFGFSPVARRSKVSLRLPRLTVTCAAGAPGARQLTNCGFGSRSNRTSPGPDWAKAAWYAMIITATVPIDFNIDFLPVDLWLTAGSYWGGFFLGMKYFTGLRFCH